MSHSGRVESYSTEHLFGVGDAAKSANDSLDKRGKQKRQPPDRRTYVTRKALESIRSSLSVRQWAILSDVSRLGVVSGGQIQALHYSASEAAKRQARSDLAALVHWQALGRLKRRIGGERAGSKGFTYSLGVAGQRLINPGRSRYRQPWTPGASYLGHALAVSQLYVELRQREAVPEAALAAFDTEPACWRTFAGVGGSRLILKPDAFVVMYVGDFEDHYFVEIDRDTEPTTRIGHKAKSYIRYLKSGREQAQTGVFPYVLWVAPDEHRAGLLIDTLSTLPADYWSPFLVTTADKAADLIATGPNTTNDAKEVR
jgi:hypothetical protein